MKKSIIILTLCSILAACATAPPPPSQGGVLLSFDAIAAQITVSHEELQAAHNDTSIAQ